MPRYADVDKLMKHAVNMDWSALKWVNEVDICTAINPNVVERKKGKWLVIGNTGLAGCECGFITDRYCMCNFCPNCGADMREEINNG